MHAYDNSHRAALKIATVWPKKETAHRLRSQHTAAKRSFPAQAQEKSVHQVLPVSGSHLLFPRCQPSPHFPKSLCNQKERFSFFSAFNRFQPLSTAFNRFHPYFLPALFPQRLSKMQRQSCQQQKSSDRVRVPTYFEHSLRSSPIPAISKLNVLTLCRQDYTSKKIRKTQSYGASALHAFTLLMKKRIGPRTTPPLNRDRHRTVLFVSQHPPGNQNGKKRGKGEKKEKTRQRKRKAKKESKRKSTGTRTVSFLLFSSPFSPFFSPIFLFPSPLLSPSKSRANGFWQTKQNKKPTGTERFRVELGLQSAPARRQSRIQERFCLRLEERKKPFGPSPQKTNALRPLNGN
jgi:hypothetical protein